MAERVAPDLPHQARIGGDEVRDGAAVAQQDAPGLRAVIAIEAAHQRGLARPGGPGERDALPGRHLEIEPPQHRQADTALQMQGEGLAEALGPERPTHAASTDATRSCV